MSEQSRSRSSNLLFGGLILVTVIAVGSVLWQLLGPDEDAPEATATAASAPLIEPRLVTIPELSEFAATTRVFWAGPREGTEIELSQPESSRVYVRYLTEGAAAGDPRPQFLTLGTYQLEASVAALKKQGRQPGGNLSKTPDGGVVYFSDQRPQSVYVAYPDADWQVEIYDPVPERALKVATSGLLTRVP